MSVQLSITIPTYNRHEMLRATVLSLIPQMDERCAITILDNGSDAPVEETLADVIRENPQARIEIHRNKYNIGANANITKCFEVTEAEWMWLLSDDDEIAPDAIATLFRSIAANPDCIYFNFALLGRDRKRTIVARGLTEFVEAIDNYQDLNLISTNVYRCDRYRSHLQHCYRFMYSCAPHLVMVIRALGADSVACLSSDTIVCNNAVNPKNVGWSWLPFALSRMTILDLPMSSYERKTLAQKIIRGKWILWHIATLLILQSYYFGKKRESLYLYDQIAYRYFYFAPWFTRSILIRLLRPLIVFPSIGHWLLRRIRTEVELRELGREDLLLRM